jgi:hypothetical protein
MVLNSMGSKTECGHGMAKTNLNNICDLDANLMQLIKALTKNSSKTKHNTLKSASLCCLKSALISYPR